MLRRTVRGTVTDISIGCPLCIGKGKKSLKLPSNAKICPDCLGFGRRLVASPKAKFDGVQDDNEIRFKPIEGGVYSESPKTTGCSRCLSRGYILLPGSR